jgi:uncharacterized protein YgfB (UPF0149 family)
VASQLSSLRALEVSVADFQPDDEELLVESGGGETVAFAMRRPAAVLVAAIAALPGEKLRHLSCWMPDHTPVPYAALLHALQPGRAGGAMLQTLRLQLVNTRNFPSHEAVHALAQLLQLLASSLQHLHLQALLVDFSSPGVFPISTVSVPCPELIQALRWCTCLRTLRFQEGPRGAHGIFSRDFVDPGIAEALVRMPELRCYAEVSGLISASASAQEWQPLVLACPRLQHVYSARLGDDSKRLELGLPAAVHDLTVGSVQHVRFLHMLEAPWRRQHLLHLEMFSQRLRLPEALQTVAQLPGLYTLVLEPVQPLQELSSALSHLARSLSLRSVVVRLRDKTLLEGTAAALHKLEMDSAFRITTLCHAFPA